MKTEEKKQKSDKSFIERIKEQDDMISKFIVFLHRKVRRKKIHNTIQKGGRF